MVALQNRVDPYGRLVATPERGLLTGNRGILHDEHRRIVRNHLSRAWITCVLDWRGRTREVMTGRTWTELFFLDEVTSLAAGHRPCAYCRRGDYKAFVAAWSLGNPALAPTTGRRAPVVDAVLHRERRTADGSKATSRHWLGSLPPGAMVLIDDRPQVVLGSGRVAEWSFDGYGRPRPADDDLHVEVLTPPSTLRAFEHGYESMLHPTAQWQ